MLNESVTVQESHCTVYPFKRICWTAIFVGALVGIGLGFLLNLFGLAIGLSAVTVDTNGGMALAAGGLIGLLIALIASMAAAGYAAGYLGRLHCPKRNLGILYGFTTWSLALILSAIVASHVTHYVSTYTNAVIGPKVAVSQDSNGDIRGTVATNSPSNDGNQTVNTAATSPTSFAYGAFVVFVLFFVGAISSCVGACCAMKCQRED